MSAPHLTSPRAAGRGIRIAVAYAAIVALGASAAQAADAPLLAKLKALCVATGADPAAAQAAADAAGWKPPAADDTRTKGGQVVRAMKDGDGHWELVVGQHPLPFAGQPVVMNMCAVGVEAAKIAPVQADVHAWLGVEPSDVSAQAIHYVFAEQAGARIALPADDDAKLLEAAHDGALRTVVIYLRKGATVMTYARPTPHDR